MNIVKNSSKTFKVVRTSFNFVEHKTDDNTISRCN